MFVTKIGIVRIIIACGTGTNQVRMGIAISGNPRPREPFENPPISKAAELPTRASIEKESKSEGIDQLYIVCPSNPLIFLVQREEVFCATVLKSDINLH
jgi:hypothetical protein